MVLLFAGTLALRPMEQRVNTLRAVAEPRGEQLAGLAGHGGVLAIFGGMRAALASGFWLRANLAWERRDPAATAALIELTVAADERPLYFWLNGARMLACDLPAWLPPAPEVVRQKRSAEHTRLALRFLEKGARWHGPDAALHVEMANLCLRQAGDVESAARYYRQAAEQPRAPYYAARIHAELLRELGRPGEALAWLRQILPALPADEPAACRDVVLARIEALEQELARR